MTVELRRITQGNIRAVIELEALPDQATFVAPNAVSIAETYVETGEFDDGEVVMIRTLAQPFAARRAV